MAAKTNLLSTTMAGRAVDAAMPGLSLSPALELWEANRAHAQGNPGAYEWWRVEAINERGDGILLLLFNGMPFHPGYLARVSRAGRRAGAGKGDSEKVQASGYPAAYMAVYAGHRRVAEFLNAYPPGSMEAATQGMEVRVGPNRLTMRPDGSIGIEARGYPFTMRAGRASHKRSRQLTATLTLVPTFAGVQQVRRFRPASRDGAGHMWIVAAPHCRAEGSVQLIGRGEATAMLDQTISCAGYHDHMMGQGVLGQDLRRCVWAHALGEDFAIVWQRTMLANNTCAPTDGLMLFQRGRDAVIIESPEIVTEQYRRTRPWLLKYPRHVLVHGSDTQGNPAELVAEHALVDASPFHWRLRGTATLTIPGRGRFVGSGSATGVMMGRLKWPLLASTVIDAILPVAANDPLWRG